MTLGVLFSYLSRSFLFWLLSVFLSLAGLFEIFDLVELLRRSSGKEGLTFAIVLQMNLLKLPHLIQDIFPFIMLFGALICFWRLAKSNELVVIRAAGISAWQILFPTLVIAFLVGILQITTYSSLAASLRSKYEALEAKYLASQRNELAISKTGLWLRQSHQDGQAVIHSNRLSANGRNMEQVVVYLFDTSGKFHARIDAEEAALRSNYWELINAVHSDLQGKTERFDRYALPTNLTMEKIQESFSSPDTLSFWELPEFIKALDEAGFDSSAHRLRFHSMLSTPILFCAMVLIAAIFSFGASRRASTSYMILGGITSGFLLYLLTNVVHALGLTTNIPVALAAWMPAGVSVMLGVTALLHMEDG
ncbi:LPS export ABC transporter permease LptG [Aestuariispira insulae]|uniref:Lipopolysaccharide export system permease protein n=1 Tax=Aestuariispira insulae TaxID=1461337 RepID=A0A3D9HX91_9PROT|nr:LPS export ABC transporter permease LptG [Aestuariispira insulae]RED53516.1 lipopolysaccharide export system permease protein [Aestuariispira insulae]